MCAHVQANQKLMEEQRRAERYLETSKESQSVKLVTPPPLSPPPPPLSPPHEINRIFLLLLLLLLR